MKQEAMEEKRELWQKTVMGQWKESANWNPNRRTAGKKKRKWQTNWKEGEKWNEEGKKARPENTLEQQQQGILISGEGDQELLWTRNGAARHKTDKKEAQGKRPAGGSTADWDNHWHNKEFILKTKPTHFASPSSDSPAARSCPRYTPALDMATAKTGNTSQRVNIPKSQQLSGLKGLHKWPVSLGLKIKKILICLLKKSEAEYQIQGLPREGCCSPTPEFMKKSRRVNCHESEVRGWSGLRGLYMPGGAQIPPRNVCLRVRWVSRRIWSFPLGTVKWRFNSDLPLTSSYNW